jgi:hypothetical protein
MVQLGRVPPARRTKDFPKALRKRHGVYHKTKQTPWALVRERTIPTERPPLVDEI